MMFAQHYFILGKFSSSLKHERGYSNPPKIIYSFFFILERAQLWAPVPQHPVGAQRAQRAQEKHLGTWNQKLYWNALGPLGPLGLFSSFGPLDLFPFTDSRKIDFFIGRRDIERTQRYPEEYYSNFTPLEKVSEIERLVNAAGVNVRKMQTSNEHILKILL